MSENIDGKSDVPKELQKILDVKEEEMPELQKFANDKNVILLAFMASYVPRRYNPSASARATMTLIDEFGIETALMELKKKVPKLHKKKLYLLVNSMGGAVSSAYKTAIAIRDAFNDITVFVPHYALSGGTLLALAGNRIKMLNGEIRDREKVMRGLKKIDTPILTGYQIYHNYLRPHMALDGKTPSDMAGIKIEGDNKWITLIQNASKKQSQLMF